MPVSSHAVPSRLAGRACAAARAWPAAVLALVLSAATGPAAALSLIDPGDAAWAASLAAGPSTGFEDASAAGTGVDAGFASLRALSPAAVMPGYDPSLPGGTGGAAGLEDLGVGAWGASGMAVSTRDLAWPYGLVIDFETPAIAVDAVWAAANADWLVMAYDAEGALIGETVVPGFDAAKSPASGGTGAEAGRLAVAVDAEEAEAAVGGGISRLELRSLGGYDWLYLDDLRIATAAPAGAGGPEAAPTPTPTPPPGAPAAALSAVPLPAGGLLMGFGLAALLAAGRARAGRRAKAAGHARG
ncbi:MAG: hypothetical protein VYD87_06790 [Pseudomonadota bacterium]|nr:hypothetical protein [Pseudomonadota bacterium]